MFHHAQNCICRNFVIIIMMYRYVYLPKKFNFESYEFKMKIFDGCLLLMFVSVALFVENLQVINSKLWLALKRI